MSIAIMSQLSFRQCPRGNSVCLALPYDTSWSSILKYMSNTHVISLLNMVKHEQLSNNQIDDIAKVIDKLPVHDKARYHRCMMETWKVDGECIQSEVPEAQSLQHLSWDDLPEQAKYAVQCWLQQDGPPTYEMEEYYSSIHAECKQVNNNFSSMPAMLSVPVLAVIKDNLERIDIGCNGCVLTFDLLIFMIRELLIAAKIQRSYEPIERLETLMRHFDHLKDRGSFLAHCAAGLPNVVVTYHTEVQKAERLCQKSVPHKRFMLIMKRDGQKKALQATFGQAYLNPAGIRLDLAHPDKTNPAQLFTFGDEEGGWITVIDSWKQRGMVWDVADADNEDPPEGTPFYLFPMHGRHNQRFEYRNKHIIACQNQQVVTYTSGENPFVMRKLDPEDRNQQFKLVYV